MKKGKKYMKNAKNKTFKGCINHYDVIMTSFKCGDQT